MHCKVNKRQRISLPARNSGSWPNNKEKMNLKNVFKMATAGKCFLFLFLTLALTGPAYGQIGSNADALLPPSPLPANSVFHAFPDPGTVEPGQLAKPMSTEEKFRLFTAQTFDPHALMLVAFVAGIEQAGNLPPAYGHGIGPYGQRVGAGAAIYTSTLLFSEAVLPTLTKQDPRYYRRGGGKVGSRIWYALSRVVVTRSDSGKAEFNVSQLGGIAISTAITNAYIPATERTASQNAIGFGVSAAFSAGINILREFGSRPPR